MKYRISNKLKTKQVQTLRRIVIMASVSILITGVAVLILHLKHPERALAAGCESTYTLDWSVPATYTVTCGSVNSSNWSVKGTTCYFYSPVFNVGGNVGDPPKIADLVVRVNQSGNLDGNDTAWVYIYANGAITHTYQRVGDVSAAVFSVTLAAYVPCGGTYQIVVKCKNDKTNELWQIKNGDVTACLKANAPLPVSLVSFTAKPDADGNVNVAWTTYTEKNNDFFTVERSTKGDSFREIKKIDGAGNSNSPKNYSYSDTHPQNGTNYYRLRQTDFDGVTTVSPVVSASVSKTTKSPGSVRVYPNPVTDKFSVEFTSDFNDEVSVRLLTMEGRILWSEKHYVEEGKANLSLLPDAKFKSGTYLIQVVSQGNVIGSTKVLYN